MAALAELPRPLTPRSQVRAFLVQLLPLDEERRLEHQASAAIMAGLMRFDRAGERWRAGVAQLRDHIRDQVVAAGSGTEPARAAAALLALTDGLASYVLGGFLDADDAVAILDSQLDAVFGPA